MMLRTAISTLLTLALLISCAPEQPTPHSQTLAPASGWSGHDWHHYLGDAHSNQYSTLTQINRDNVGNLQQAWRIDFDEPGNPQTNPLVIDGVLYGLTPKLKVFAADAATGEIHWQFDPRVEGAPLGIIPSFTGASRGLSFWRSGNERRLLVGTMNYLHALDPESGEPVAGFGDNGRIDLRKGLRGDYKQHYVSLTTPGVVFENLIITGFRAAESPPAAPGDIRAYDVLTGKMAWRFRTIPEVGEPGHQSWPEGARDVAGGANNWTGMALDERRGLVYVPTGSAVPDFFGGDRLGDNRYANSLLALDARSGELVWHYQTTHHDIWDRDLPSPPSLLRIRRDGNWQDVVAQPTKQGLLFVFDRDTGAPVFPIEERPAPASDVKGEHASLTQPFPLLPAPFARQQLTEADLTQRTEAANAWARAALKGMRNGGPYLPFSVGQPTIMVPGYDGGAEWGGAAVDPNQGVIYINANDIAATGSLASNTGGHPLARLYGAQCGTCHGEDLTGAPPEFPSLVGLTQRLSRAEIESIIVNGKGRMPGFATLGELAIAALVRFIEDPQTSTESVEGSDSRMVSAVSSGADVPYQFTGYNQFRDPDGYPAVAPPWGTLNAIDLNTGEYLWRQPLGEYPDLTASGTPATGTENYGGPVVTASGLLFIGATVYDRKIRAFDTDSGELLWQHKLPFAGTATPATYWADGRQFIVIATNGNRDPSSERGTAYVAFALPDSR